jgi:hypothetical protein
MQAAMARHRQPQPPPTPTPPPPSPPPGTSGAGIIIPFYIDPPSTDFNKVIALKQQYPSVPLYIILNPDNGPGSSYDSAYATVIGQLQASGAVVIGYVYTNYGARSTSTVEANISRWQSFYPTINGIFFDEMSDATGTISYYTALTAFVHRNGMSVAVGNPGTEMPAAFFAGDVMDNLVISETGGWPNTSAIENDGVGAPTQKSIIVYDAALNSADLALAAQYNKLIWVTSDTLPNPYDSLPSYLSQLFAALNPGS